MPFIDGCMQIMKLSMNPVLWEPSITGPYHAVPGDKAIYSDIVGSAIKLYVAKINTFNMLFAVP